MGDVEVKQKLFIVLNEFLSPIRERRLSYESNLDIVKDILKEGSIYVRNLADKTLEEVREKMKLPAH